MYIHEAASASACSFQLTNRVFDASLFSRVHNENCDYRNSPEFSRARKFAFGSLFRRLRRGECVCVCRKRPRSKAKKTKKEKRANEN